MTQQLIAMHAACGKFKVDRRVLPGLIEKAGLKPLMETKGGRGYIRYYDPKALGEICRQYHAEKAPEKAPGEPVVLTGVEARLKALRGDLEDQAAVLERLDQARDLLLKQNQLVFKELEKLNGQVSKLLTELGVKAGVP